MRKPTTDDEEIVSVQVREVLPVEKSGAHLKLDRFPKLMGMVPDNWLLERSRRLPMKPTTKRTKCTKMYCPEDRQCSIQHF